MRTAKLDAIGNSRSRLLAALLGLCLLGLAGPAAAATHHPTAAGGNAILAAVADVAATARTLPERITPAHRAGLDRHLPPSPSLPAAVLIAFLLAIHAGRRRAIGAAPKNSLLVAAGRGPPATS